MGVTGPEVADTSKEVVWTSNKTALYRLSGPNATGVPVLVVHSLVSQPWILDLMPERSFLAALGQEGFDVFLLDWGNPDRSDAQNDLSHYANLLMDAEKKVIELTGKEKLHLVGYCLGATLCLARLGARTHPLVASAALIAAPGDFGVPSGLQKLLSHRMLKPAYFLDASACVPSALVRESFHVLRPQALRTVRALMANRKDETYRRAYGALSRWVWQHRNLPGALFFDLVDLFRSNSLVEGHLEVAGEIARLQDIDVPLGVFVADRDHIVPSGSSHALRTVPGLEVDVFNYASGHVSMVCGRKARGGMWADLARWLRRTNGSPSN